MAGGMVTSNFHVVDPHLVVDPTLQIYTSRTLTTTSRVILALN